MSFLSFGKLIVGSLLIGVLAAISYYRLSDSVPIRGERLSRDALALQSVDIGTLKPGEKKNFDVVIRNQHTNAIELLPPRVSCGCIAAIKEPFVVEAGSRKSVQFTYHAGDRPGPVEQKIIFLAASETTVNWTVDVFGKVAADIWADPPTISFMFDLGDRPIAELLLHRKPGLMIADVIVDSDAVNLEATIQSADAEKVVATVSLRDVRADGTGNILVLGEGGARLLAVPVRWTKRLPFKFHPRKLLLSPEQLRTSGTIDRKIIVYRGPKAKGRDVRSDVLVPWIHVVKTDDNGSAVVLHVQLDADRVPQEFLGSVLKLSVDDGDTWVFYTASVTYNSDI